MFQTNTSFGLDFFGSLIKIIKGEKISRPNQKQYKESSSVSINGEYFLNNPDYMGNRTVRNFSSAKNILKKLDYLGVKEDLYCGCEFSGGRIPENAKCGLSYRKNRERAYRIEFEHIVPFENQVGHTTAWKVGLAECGERKGRSCASKVFSHMEGDLWNLYPAGGEMNADRSNYSYAMIPGVRNQYGKCNFKIEDRKAEPRDEVKAMIALTYMYMDKTYAGFLKTHYISDKNQKLFESWSRMPLKQYQCDWARKVAKIQRNDNSFLLNACLKQSL